MPAARDPHRRLPLILLLVFVAYWALLAWKPQFRRDWALENLLVFVGVPWLVWGYRRVCFSNLSYVLIFVFLLLHELGAHYTYARVPYEDWTRHVFGVSLNDALGLQRNHYDRLVHFLSGLLLTPAISELVQARASPASPFWRGFLPWCVVVAFSAFFELIEWAAVVVSGGPLGNAYLGAQGDPWDAQQDMAQAAFGALLSVCWLAWRRHRAALRRPRAV